MTTPEPLVDVRSLGKIYDGRAVIGDLTLRLAPGEMVGLVGANGGGKTTSLRMIGGLLRPDAGDGWVLGHDVRNSGADRRRRIGYMPQQPALYPDLTVTENLRFRAEVFGLASARARIAEVACRYGVTPALKTRFGRLSGGWARRVQFAATVLPAPALLLLDEPTAGLDGASRRDIWRWLDTLAARGLGVIVSTHDLIEAERFASIVFFEGGRAHGPMAPADLIGLTGAQSLEDAVIQFAAERAT